jgi:sigma-B regulation protein RsbU (phosphoserine phosphatase)
MTNKKPLPPILYVDDEIDNLTVFNSAFRRYYEIHLASSGREGLEIMKKNEIRLVITDQRMPVMTGTEFLEKIIPDYADCIRIILTGFSDIDAVIQAINKGRVYRYITKPWDREEMKITIDNALETYNLKQQNKRLFEELKEANMTLEQKVIDRTKKIEDQNREITNSIYYASKIQNALLPPKDELDRLLPSYFVLNKPREVIGGDYYWLTHKENKLIAAVADCTGHGVPGSFMSILGITLLNEIVDKSATVRADEILNQLRINIINSLHQSTRRNGTRDGMEIALCILDFDNGMLQFAGAFRPLYLIRENQLHILDGDTMPIGIYDDERTSFKRKEIPFRKDDLVYLFTDGYVDQIGGINRKTFRAKHFKDLLLEIHRYPMDDQKEKLWEKFMEWKGDIEQIDDILILGIKI